MILGAAHRARGATDYLGSPLTPSDPATLAAIDDFVGGFIAYEPRALAVLAAAESVEVSEDGLVYTYRLRHNAKWHLTPGHEDVLGEEGFRAFQTRVTAHDFVFALRRAVDPATGSGTASALLLIQNAGEIQAGKLSTDRLGVQALADDTLAITLESKNRDLAAVLAMPVALPCNQTFFEATKGRYGKDAALLLCNGPFYLTKWTAEKSLRLEKNTDSWRARQVQPAAVTF